ncbi:benomyl/methotrexate resistance protein [Sporormia fimetaria CBS 119925]|uniref:Benomyl/methotrexate resistance protein n=1 Tax=Sporormia fimetaria CBS 119925 TaxID=1340428 RepID=A0A6A6V5C3_9PLEO|nr:benomyl/methotrexate resistance protein [Sporormia fimetaria CBS 119925]
MKEAAVEKEKDLDSQDIEERSLASNAPENNLAPAKEADASMSAMETESSQGLVDWEGEDDPQKPMNWTRARKAKNIVVICYLTFLTPLGSTMFAPAIGSVMKDFNSTSPLLSSFTVSIWVLGYFFGPLFLAPLSELYGRLPVYLTCNTLFTIFNLATALSPNLTSLIIFRFLAGTCGGCPITIGAGTFGDLIRPQSRGLIIAIWSLGPLMGPILGPIAGGYMGQSIGWRWICWVMGIASGLGALLSFICQEETYPPILLSRKLTKLRQQTGNPNLHTPYTLTETRTPRQIFAKGIIRPLRLLFLSPIVASLSLYQGLVYGYLYLLFTTFPLVFKSQYSFSVGTIGLTYLGLGVGSLLSLVAIGIASDLILKRLAAKHAAEMKPEFRLPPLIPSAYFLPIGLFWYGWAAEKAAHWIVPILGTVWIGFGVNAVMMVAATYLIDAHPRFEASAMAASTAVRSLIGAFVPLAGRSMYEKLGLGWGNSLLGFFALAMCPLPWVFWRVGERIRKNPRFQIKM